MRTRFICACALTALFGLQVACSSRDAGTAPATDSALASASQSNGSASSTSGITGTVGSLSGTCPALTFKLEGKVIKTAAATRFDGITCADVKNGTRVTVTGPTQTDQSVQAEKVTRAAAAATTPPTTTPTTPTTTPPTTAAGTVLTITGTTSGLAGTCPEVSFALEGKTVRTNPATVYSGGTCADVKSAIRVTITGTTQADGRVLAAKLTFLAAATTPTTTPPTTTPTTPAATTVTVTGTTSGVAGTCPTVSFALEGKRFVISAATTYERGACADIRNAIRVTATGTAQADGSYAATRVAFQL